MPAFPCYGVIPARFASTRLPAKPLADILGRPMFWHVYCRALESGVFRTVWLATDDARIEAAAREHDVPCLMTSPDHASGTDRVHEAAVALGIEPEAVVVNIQGDEPAMDPVLLAELVEPFTDPAVRVSTVAAPVSARRALDPNQVKVVLNAAGDALYFSRSLVPHVRDMTPDPPDPDDTTLWLGHIGLYAFRMEALRRFVALGPSRLERLEKLEQLRFLEHGIPIRVVRSHRHSQGVDTPEDLERVRALLAVRLP